MRKKEIFWFFGLLILFLILILTLFGIEGFNNEAVLDINVHDTYFVIPNQHLFIGIGIFYFFLIYLIRSIITKFKKNIINIILIISIILLVLILNDIKTTIEIFSLRGSGFTVYPPLSHNEELESINNEFESGSSWFNFILYLIYCFKIILLILLPYTGFKTRQNYP